MPAEIGMIGMNASRRNENQSKGWIRQYAKWLESSEQADIAGPRGLIGSYLAVIKAPAAAISNRENEQHCSAGEMWTMPFNANWYYNQTLKWWTEIFIWN